MFKKILVAYDGSNGANQALRVGIDFARCLRLDLHLVMVEELPCYAGSIDEVNTVKEQKDAYFGQLGREATAIAGEEGVTLHKQVVVGPTVSAISEHVKQDGFDLLVIGWHKHSWLFERLIGSTSRELVFGAPCNILLVK